MKKTIYINGRIGNQLLRYFTAITHSIENDYEVGAIIIARRPNFLIEMLELKIPITQQLGIRRNDVEHNVDENIHILFKHKDRLLKEGWMRLKKVENYISAKICIHLRGSDKKIAPLQWYCNKTKDISDRIYVCTEDKKYGNTFMVQLANMKIKKDIVFTQQDDIKDWHTILVADEVYCSASSFPLSTLLFNPNKKIIVCSRKSSTYDYGLEGKKVTEFQFIETAMNYCPNLRFED